MISSLRDQVSVSVVQVSSVGGGDRSIAMFRSCSDAQALLRASRALALALVDLGDQKHSALCLRLDVFGLQFLSMG